MIIILLSFLFLNSWILFEARKSRRLIRIPIIILLLFTIFLSGWKLCFTFFSLERSFFHENMCMIERRLRSNDLYSVKASVITYNKASRTMNNYKAIILMYKAMQCDYWTKKYYKNDPLMQTNIESKIINKSDN